MGSYKQNYRAYMRLILFQNGTKKFTEIRKIGIYTKYKTPKFYY